MTASTRVLVAMSGGVDSSVAAALLLERGVDVTGVTMKLWGGESDTGCCSVADVDDARRVAATLGIDHHVFNFGDDFETRVIGPYVAEHAAGRTPNPCIECNRHIKFDKLLRRAAALGFDVVATGHHARVRRRADGTWRISRGADGAKDQSYVLGMLGQPALARVVLPIGDLTKDEVRARAGRLGLRTAGKPDSQDVCFIASTVPRAGFLGRRVALHPGRVIDAGGREVGRVDAVELVTVGQRKGLGLSGGGAEPRYVVDVDVPAATITIGGRHELVTDEVGLRSVAWADEPVAGELLAQCSAHGEAHRAVVEVPAPGVATVRWRRPQRRVAPGQTVVLYEGDDVVGSGLAAA
ncbi:MAG: tRNA 2-thiouridine(34) synthase MnmA [Acidimicrobiales bacterium]